VPAVDREGAADCRADRSRRIPERHAGFHRTAQLLHLVELLRVGKHVIDAIPRRLEERLLMDRFGRVRDLLAGGPDARRAKHRAADGHGGSNDHLPAAGWEIIPITHLHLSSAFFKSGTASWQIKSGAQL
jgi:hypothetical protein